MSATATFTWKRPRATDGIAPVAEGSDIPEMRPMTGKRGTDRKLIARLDEALESLARSNCTFWACRGPSKPQAMATCVKCYAMRDIAAVRASLVARCEPVR